MVTVDGQDKHTADQTSRRTAEQLIAFLPPFWFLASPASPG
jgi:hypothetical protein